MRRVTGRRPVESAKKSRCGSLRLASVVCIAAVAATGCGSAAAAAKQSHSPPGRLFALNPSFGTIRQIDEQTNRVVSTIRAGVLGGFSVAPNGNFAYVWGQGVYRVSLIGDRSSREIARTNPVFDVVFDPSGNEAAVSYGLEGQEVALINTTTSRLTKLDVGHVQKLGIPYDAAFLPNGRTLYVLTSNGFAVPINVSTGAVGTPIGHLDGRSTGNATATPNGRELYVLNLGAGSVSVIDTTTNRVVKTIGVGSSPGFVVFTPNGRTAYVANSASDSVSVINVLTNRTIATIPVGKLPNEMAVTQDGKMIYVVDNASEEVTPIRVGATTAEPPIRVHHWILDIALTPNGRGAYVGECAPGAHQVIPINLVSDQPGKPIDVGGISPDCIEVAAAP